MVKLLLCRDANVDEKAKHIDTVLHMAVASTQIHVVKFLFMYGADMNALRRSDTVVKKIFGKSILRPSEKKC